MAGKTVIVAARTRSSRSGDAARGRGATVVLAVRDEARRRGGGGDPCNNKRRQGGSVAAGARRPRVGEGVRERWGDRPIDRLMLNAGVMAIPTAAHRRRLRAPLGRQPPRPLCAHRAAVARRAQGGGGGGSPRVVIVSCDGHKRDDFLRRHQPRAARRVQGLQHALLHRVRSRSSPTCSAAELERRIPAGLDVASVARRAGQRRSSLCRARRKRRDGLLGAPGELDKLLQVQGFMTPTAKAAATQAPSPPTPRSVMSSWWRLVDGKPAEPKAATDPSTAAKLWIPSARRASNSTRPRRHGRTRLEIITACSVHARRSVARIP